MKLKDVKVGDQYETKFGVGTCLEIDVKNSPPAARFHIIYPVLIRLSPKAQWLCLRRDRAASIPQVAA